jgi:hypothetical protein
MKKNILYVLLILPVICIIGLNVSIALSDSYELRLKQLESLANESWDGLEDGEVLYSSENDISMPGKKKKTITCDLGGTKTVCESTNDGHTTCYSSDETDCPNPAAGGDNGSGSGSGSGSSSGSGSGSDNTGGSTNICLQQGHDAMITMSVVPPIVSIGDNIFRHEINCFRCGMQNIHFTTHSVSTCVMCTPFL